jgi:hypothetical protein
MPEEEQVVNPIEQEQEPEQKCGSCGIILRNGNKYTSMGRVISDEQLENICRLSKKRTGCFNQLKLLGVKVKTNIESPLIKATNDQIEDMVRNVISSLKDSGIKVESTDHFVTLEWLKDGTKTQVSVDYKYCATTVLEGLDANISICIEFLDSINEGYLSFLRPELVKGITLSGQHFNVLEGNNIVATGYFK